MRTIQADSCVDLARAAALSTALVIEPSAITRGGNDDSATTETAPTLAAPNGVAPKMRSPQGLVSQPRGTLRIVPGTPSAAPVPIPRRADFFGVAAVASGVLPGAALGVAIGAEFALRHVVVRSEIGTYLPQSWREEKEGYKGSFWLSEVFQSACYPIGASRFRISPCVGASLQGYLVQVQDLNINHSSSRLAWAVRVGMGVDAKYRISHSAVLLGTVQGLAGLTLPEFRLHPDTRVFSPETLIWRTTLGVAWDLF